MKTQMKFRNNTILKLETSTSILNKILETYLIIHKDRLYHNNKLVIVRNQLQQTLQASQGLHLHLMREDSKMFNEEMMSPSQLPKMTQWHFMLELIGLKRKRIETVEVEAGRN